MLTGLMSLQNRVRWLDLLFRCGLRLLPGTPVGRPLLRELIVAYDTADDRGRRDLRSLLERRDGFVQSVALPRPVASSESFRQHLLHFSLVYACGDPRDGMLWLHDLCREALEAGVDLEPVLRQVGAISSDEGGPSWSARAQLFSAADHCEGFEARARPRRRRSVARSNP